MHYQYKNKPINLESTNLFNKELNLPLLMGGLLTARGILTLDSAIDYLGKEGKLFDPFLMKDMRKATDRILKAIEKKEHIYICGDFDVDGITSTSILLRFFNSIGYPIYYRLPTQIEGHGLSNLAVQEIKDKGGSLIITVDNGSTSYDAVKLANKLKIDVIITDHHDISQEGLPKALAIINPKQSDCKSPYRYLSGGGIALFLARGIAKALKQEDKLTTDLFVLASISTIADVAPLTDDNRTLVKIGLNNLLNSNILGLDMLMEKSGVPTHFCARDVSFKLAPTINAAGKFGYAEEAITLLTSNDFIALNGVVKKLRGINDERKNLISEIIPGLSEKARKCVEKKDYVIVVDGDHNSAVSGLVAARLAEEFQKPTIVVSFADGDEGRASCRSVDGFNMQLAIEDLKEYHLGGGGHYMAAGLALRKDQFDTFKRLINLYAAEKMANKEGKVWTIDAEISAEQLDSKMFKKMLLMEPLGAKNENPLFKIRGLKLKKNSYGKNSSYTCKLKDIDVRVYNNLEASMGELPDGKEINAIIEMTFQDGNPLFMIKDFEIE